MTKDEILELARQAGGYWVSYEKALEYGNACIQQERERCANVVESDLYLKWDATPGSSFADFARMVEKTCKGGIMPTRRELNELYSKANALTKVTKERDELKAKVEALEENGRIKTYLASMSDIAKERDELRAKSEMDDAMLAGNGALITELRAKLAELHDLRDDLDTAMQHNADLMVENNALKAKLSLLETDYGIYKDGAYIIHEKLRAKIKELEQQEPVAWRFVDVDDNNHPTYSSKPPTPEQAAYLKKWNRPAWEPLYAAPGAKNAT